MLSLKNKDDTMPSYNDDNESENGDDSIDGERSRSICERDLLPGTSEQNAESFNFSALASIYIKINFSFRWFEKFIGMVETILSGR